jgi:hypothetical protein
MFVPLSGMTAVLATWDSAVNFLGLPDPAQQFRRAPGTQECSIRDIEKRECHEFKAEDAPDDKPSRVVPVELGGLRCASLPGRSRPTLRLADLIAACCVRAHVWFTSFALFCLACVLYDSRLGHLCYLR